MTQKEEKLLEIAKNVIAMNTGINAALTGSLLLVHSDYRTRREASDIDIICDTLCAKEEGSPNVPAGFTIVEMDGGGSEVDSIVYQNEEGVKIDFMWSDESKKTINGILCGSPEYLVRAKLSFARNDKTEESRQKHLDDVLYLINENDILLSF